MSVRLNDGEQHILEVKILTQVKHVLYLTQDPEKYRQFLNSDEFEDVKKKVKEIIKVIQESE